ncbi:hypothetical protein AB4Z01_33880 [Inquilinus sp. YAF38]|uniref:hypothetical protein n=1 Tax=Inquilinus sp. YAF38 TaxID=3233084 RepID=UPI003F8D9DF3
MMPVPTHLIDCVVPLESGLDQASLKAAVRCSCSSVQFRLLFPGQAQEHEGRQIPSTAKIGGQFFFLLKAHCTGCGRKNLLFDADFHGWNGFVCHEPEMAARTRPPLVPWACQSCGGLHHTGIVTISTEGREDFVAEAGDEFDPERWPDGFGWFALDVTCVQCGVMTKDLVSYETM